jgi:hypothetical protein
VADATVENLEQFCESGTTLSFNTPDKHLGGMTYGGFSQTYVPHHFTSSGLPVFERRVDGNTGAK